MFNVDPKVVQRALAMHSGNAGFQDPGQRQQMYDYIAKHSDEATKHQYEMEKTKAASTWHSDNNVRSNATRIQVEQMKDAVTNTKTQSQAMTALQVAAQKNGTAQDKMVVDLVGKYVAASLPPPDDLAAQAHDVLFRAHQGASEGEGGGRGPQQIQTQGNPNANQQFQPPTQQMRGPDGNIHSFVLQNGKYVQQ
jgi:hypothetical protein